MIITKAKINNAIKSPPIINPVQNSLISITTHHNTNNNQAKCNNQTTNNYSAYKHYPFHLNTPSQGPQNPPTRISLPVWSPG